MGLTAGCLLLATSAAAQPITAQPTPAAPPALTLTAALERAMAVNPALGAARLTTPVNVARVNAARERPNPEARVEFERETPTRAYSVTMPIELGCKRARRVAVGDAELDSGLAAIAQSAADVRAAVRTAYFDVVASEQRLVLLDEIHGIALRARDAAQARFAAGRSPRLEVLQAALAAAQAENDATAAHAEATAARATFNALLAWPLDTTAPLVTALDAGDVPTVAAALTRARAGSAESMAARTSSVSRFNRGRARAASAG